MNDFQDSINKQISFNQGKNLFVAGDDQSISFIEQTVNAASRIGEVDKATEALLIDYATDMALQEFCRVNQYYSFDAKAKALLRDLYVLLFSEIREQGIELAQVSKNHFNRLREWLKLTNPFSEIIYTSEGATIEATACSEYSAALQLELLQLDIEDLIEPVLDIGCGKQGMLVNYLREAGIEAYGIDRFAAGLQYAESLDWLEYPYGVMCWGTITSNLGFSNHFKHHHLRNDGKYIDYARKYIEILRSLKVGGSFHYAPGIPFIEQYLNPLEYRVICQAIGSSSYAMTRIIRLK